MTDLVAPQRTLYDSVRGIHYARPLLRGRQHLVWFVASVVLAPIVLTQQSGAVRLAALAVYTSTVTILFGTSALYHCRLWTARMSARLQRADHAAIYLLIAGTAAAVFMLSTRGALRWGVLIAIAALTTTAIVAHLAWMHAPEALVGSSFAGLGLLAGLGLPAVWMRSGVLAALLVLAGGALYLVGAVSFQRRRPDPYPSVFGYHEVFHAYVCAGAACHYVALVVLIR